MLIRIKGARIIDPPYMDAKKDIIIKDHLIHAIVDPEYVDPEYKDADPNIHIIDAAGKILVPGLIDIHVHLREPGQEYKETIETGLAAAARGGFTTVCCMPNTNPVNDNSQVTRFIIQRGREVGLSRVYPVGAITRGLKGETLAEIHDMKQAGIVAVTDDGKPVLNSNLMRRALEYCRGLNIPVFVHAEDTCLADSGSMNEGSFSTFWGIKGIPNAAESVMVVRDIALSELTDAPVHFCHISTKESIEAIRQAKKRGAKITCETAPHYFTLTDEDVKEYDTNFKMNPPLRSKEDRQAVIEGLSDGTIDLIASDHAPHSVVEKDVEFDRAAFGIVGLETSLSLALKLVHDGNLTLPELIHKMAKQPAKILGINNDIKEGSRADLTLIDPDHEYVIDPSTFRSKSRNTPFAGMKVKGDAFLTMGGGKVVYQRDGQSGGHGDHP
ncbi:MAG: dihydroorotase [Desulfobacula sp. RIFOXYA12_FULL_46_16]|nr:MAG: dihydroorotase [Deltaproteobacteria bacterium RIFOXYC2_FULL_48_10]OGR21065.1 MAG: dihydroorotase [Desulfobacula sp. RIFOXYA12_FULL_46_16]